MGKPVPGTYYTVKGNDTLRNIARAAYGRDLADLIQQVNSRVLLDRKTSAEGLKVIRGGDVLYIPLDTSTPRYAGRRNITADFDNPISIELDGVVYKSFKATSISRAMNEIAAGFAFEAPFSLDDKALVEKLKPYSYKTAALYVDGELFMTAKCMKWDYAFSTGGRVATIETRTRTGDLCECSAGMGYCQYKNASLLTIARETCKPYDLKVYSEAGDSEPFDDVVKEVAELDFDFLNRLAQQAGFLMKPGKDGSLYFTRAAVDAKPVASLRAGEFPVLSCSTSYDGSKRFSEITGTTESEDSWGLNETIQDKSIPHMRPLIFKAEEANKATLKTAVQWRMSESIVASTAITVTLAGWRNPEGRLWEENTMVTFCAPQCFILKETSFLIQKVVLTKDESGGDIAELSLVLPEAYTLGLPSSYPWDTK
jgi:prophage tail gpP-like protein